jgi:hypothetical protein
MAATREEKAAELYAGGSSINAVAKELGISWYDAKKLKPVKEEAVVGGGEDPDEGGNWDITLSTPTARLSDIFAEFSNAEKATAIATVLQARLDAILAPATI